MVQVQIKILIGEKVETTQGDVKQTENLVQKDLLQRNKDKGNKARSAQDERMIAQGKMDYIIKETELRQRDKAIKSHSQMPQKAGLYWAKVPQQMGVACPESNKIAIVKIVGDSPMLRIEWMLSHVKSQDDDGGVHTNLKIKPNVDPAKVEWGAEIHVPDDNLDKIV